LTIGGTEPWNGGTEPWNGGTVQISLRPLLSKVQEGGLGASGRAIGMELAITKKPHCCSAHQGAETRAGHYVE